MSGGEAADWADPALIPGDCPLSRTLEIVGGKWNALILRELLTGDRRFNELRAALSPITAKTLVERLRLLQDYDVVQRLDEETTPPLVIYSLTARGRSLRPVLAALWRWGVADEHSWA